MLSHMQLSKMTEPIISLKANSSKGYSLKDYPCLQNTSFKGSDPRERLSRTLEFVNSPQNLASTTSEKQKMLLIDFTCKVVIIKTFVTYRKGIKFSTSF